MMWDKWKGKPRQLLLLFVSGLLLLFIAAPARGNEREEYFGNGMANTENLAYEEGLENKLEQILMKMEGVGKAEVMLTFKEFSETYTVMEKYPVPQGILIIAEGGGNKVAENNIREAVQALFGLEAHKIRIMKMTQNR